MTASVDRRRFLSAAACALLAPWLDGCASLAVRPVTPVDGRVQLPLRQYPELAEPGGSLKIQPSGASNPIYVLAVDDGGFVALSPICTHLGCTVEIEGQRLVCPCHGSTYDRSGKVLVGPAARSLASFPTRVDPDGVLIIDLRRTG